MRPSLCKLILLTGLCQSIYAGNPCFSLSSPLLEPQWNALGEGLNGNGYVHEIAVLGSDIYVGGSFTDAAGDPNVDYIARWDGCEWYALGPGLNAGVLAITTDGIDVYVCGGFTDAGGNPDADYIARWDGNSWNTVAPGLNAVVGDIAIDGNNVYATGRFTDVGGNPDADHLARWDGVAWHALGAGFDGVGEIIISGGDLYASGNFQDAGGNQDADYIARWDGSAWHALGNGFAGAQFVSALAISGSGDVYVGGAGWGVGVSNACGVARWDGNSWHSLGDGLSDCEDGWGVDEITISSNGDVYAVGSFSGAGGIPNTTNIARWDGISWHSMGIPALHTLTESVKAIATNGSDVYVGGKFPNIGNAPNTFYIARWGEPDRIEEIPGLTDILCQNDLPLSLPTSILGYTGHWSGQGVDNNIFYPSGLSGSIPIMFEPGANECMYPDESAITVVTLSPTIWNQHCNNNNTPSDKSDDVIQINFNAMGYHLGADYTVSSSVGSISPGTGLYETWTAFQWQPGSDGNRNFTLTVSDNAAPFCSFEFFIEDPGPCLQELDYEIFIPTVFSPNGDGINDVVMIYSNSQVQNIRLLRFFSRWGELVSERSNFSPNDPRYGWDGSKSGKKLNPGVYSWVAEVEFVDGNVELFSGGVTLIR